MIFAGAQRNKDVRRRTFDSIGYPKFFREHQKTKYNERIIEEKGSNKASINNGNNNNNNHNSNSNVYIYWLIESSCIVDTSSTKFEYTKAGEKNSKEKGIMYT